MSKSATKKSATSASEKSAWAENGQASKSASEIGQIISSTGAWIRPACKDDNEVIERISEYQNLCALKEEPPYIEDLCLYLGISKEKMQEWRRGETCSKELKDAVDRAFTWVLAIDNKLADKGKKYYVLRIWSGKQWHNEKEPNSKLEDLLAVNLLKELPSASAVASKYLTEVAESESE